MCYSTTTPNPHTNHAQIWHTNVIQDGKLYQVILCYLFWNTPFCYYVQKNVKVNQIKQNKNSWFHKFRTQHFLFKNRQQR